MADSKPLKVHHLRPAPGAHTAKTRVGRGEGSKGKSAGRGTKGTGARKQVSQGFEGGQMPLHMRVPKLRGFNNPFRVEYQAVNLDTLDETGLTDITPASLHGAGLVHKGALIKVLGRGEITRAVHVKAHRFSKSAEAAITEAGGTVELVPLPWGDRRPPVQGNQFANR